MTVNIDRYSCKEKSGEETLPLTPPKTPNPSPPPGKKFGQKATSGEFSDVGFSVQRMFPFLEDTPIFRADSAGVPVAAQLKETGNREGIMMKILPGLNGGKMVWFKPLV